MATTTFAMSHSALLLTVALLLVTIVPGSAFGGLQARRQHLQQKSLMTMKLVDRAFDALLFDCDGVIAETERDAHRVTFNEAFKAKGVTAEWGVEEYGELLKIGGGKERMTHYFNKVGWPSASIVGTDEAQRKQFIQDLHLLKTAKFQGLVESGAVPLRPGVARLVDDALENGINVAVCSTSSVDAVTTIVRTLLGKERLAKMQIFAGDMVKNKKPAPDVYLLAATTLKVDPTRCWVVEDSEIGLRAAKGANMRCVVTKSIYTANENFASAEATADVCIENLDRGRDGAVTCYFLNFLAKGGYKAAPSTSANANMFASDKQDVGSMFKKIADGKSGMGFPF